MTDGNPRNAGSNIGEICVIGSTMYFSANDGYNGQELWKSDGTSSGTVLVRNIGDGTTTPLINGDPKEFANLNGVLIFSAQSVSTGIELWRSDGTSSGTTLVSDLATGSGNASPRDLTVSNGMLYFTASGGFGHRVLWRSDGTSIGTTVVSTIDTTSLDEIVAGPEGILYFRANDGGPAGLELWRSDGTSAGTWIVRDIYAGTNSSFVDEMISANGRLYFNAGDGIGGRELWTSDGTSSGTVLIRDINPGSFASYPEKLTFHEGSLYFFARTNVYGNELWRSDGTSEGTAIVRDIYPGGAGAISTAANGVGRALWSFDSALYFSASDGVNGSELWRSDGTSSGTTLFKDLVPGANSGNPRLPIAHLGSKFYFLSSGLWSTDGTPAGTLPVPGATPAGSPDPTLAVLGDSLYFSGFTSVHGSELLTTDGVDTSLVCNILSRTNSSSPTSFLVVDQSLSFTANDGVHALELWRSDATSTGTVMVYDVRPEPYYGTFDTNFYSFAALGGSVYFSAGISDTTKRGMLYRSSGTAGDGSLVMSAADPNSPREVRELTEMGGTLYFRAGNIGGRELWRSDGTAAGTFRIKDIHPTGESLPTYLFNAGGVLYFTANNGTTGSELWKSDGTSTGTVLVRDINPGTTGSSINQFAFLNGVIYFRANDGVNGVELWRSDGTSSGTVLVRDINPGLAASTPTGLTAFNGALYFSANGGATGTELWRSDGTSSGTALFKDLNSVTSGSPSGFTAMGLHLYFSGNGTNQGFELWRTDGTTSGTVLVRDIAPPAGGSQPSRLVNAAGVLYFRATDGTNGYELWSSDGTSSGTVMIDVEAGLAADPTDILAIGGRIYFSGNRSDVGRELFTLADTTAPTLIQIASASPNGTYTTGQPIDLTLRFSEPLTLTGSLLVTLDTGATLTVPAFTGDRVTVMYVAQAGETSHDLAATAVALSPGSTLTDAAGNLGTVALPASNLGANSSLIVNPLPPTTVSLVTVNGGAAQRSRVTIITLNFAAPQNAAVLNGLGAITLTRGSTVVQTGATGASGRITVAPASGMVSSVTLTFSNADGAVTSPAVEHGSLSDGRWQLSIPYFSHTSDLHRLFGDANGDATIDGANDFAVFGNRFGTTPGVGASPFDFNNDGTINGTVDFAQFGARFGQTV